MKRKRMAAAALAAGALLASPAFAVCDNCGSVSEVKTIKKEGEAGAKVEKVQKSTTSYQVTVKLENGATRTFTYGAPTAYKAGDRVKIVDKKLVRQ